LKCVSAPIISGCGAELDGLCAYRQPSILIASTCTRVELSHWVLIESHLTAAEV
jgi:hypothetical protein